MPGPDRQIEGIGLYALAGALMTGGPVWHYLFVNRYPFTRPEAIVLPLAAALLGAGIAATGRRIGGVVATLVFGALLFVFVDLQFDLEHWVVGTLFVAVGCVVMALVLRARRAALVSISLGAFYVASLPRAAADAPVRVSSAVEPALRTNPVLVHVVLDEQWGIGGLRAAGDSATAQFLSNFYFQRGFEVYEGAYSRWHTTRWSIPSLLSLDGPMAVEPLPGVRFRMISNPYFQGLRALGYEIHVYQSTFLDYCHTPGVVVAWCESEPGNTIANIGYLEGPWVTRALLAGRYTVDMTSDVYNRFRGEKDEPVWRRSFAGRGLEELRDVRNALAAGLSPGTTIFVHLLLPHEPLEVDANCRLSAPRQRVYYDKADLNDSTWRQRVTLYGAQVRCVHRAMADLLAALDSTVGRDGAIVIVHGDHGSRMSQRNSTKTALSAWDAQQLNSAFSTLLAIRRPHMPAARHTEAVPVQDFFWELFGRGFKGSVNGPWRHFVEVKPTGKGNLIDTLRVLDASDMPWASPSH